MVKLDNTKIRKLLASRDFGHNTTKYGQQLEDLICYIFEKLPHVSLKERNLQDRSNGREIDLVFWNDHTHSGLYFLHSIIPVECKNWSKPVTGNELIMFATLLKNRGLSFGIFVARSGITGKELKGTDGYGDLQNILHDGCKILIITERDLENITDTDQIVELLKQKLCKLVIAT